MQTHYLGIVVVVVRDVLHRLRFRYSVARRPGRMLDTSVAQIVSRQSSVKSTYSTAFASGRHGCDIYSVGRKVLLMFVLGTLMLKALKI